MENRHLVFGGIIVVILAAGAIWYFGSEKRGEQITVPGDATEVSNLSQRVEFTYYGGAEGYTLLESFEDVELGHPLLSKAYTLVDTDRYIENNQAAAGVGSTIPGITMLIFDEDEATSTSASSTATSTDEAPEPTLAEWAATYSGFTAYGLRTEEPESVRVDGLSAIRFRSDGPFPSETYIVKHRGKYYVLVGQYENESDEIRNAFRKLITEIYFL